MRIITGTARGHRLKAPKGLETRPTLDRIREALFNIISASVPDSKFLDLYAGTGAVGIEAISRGAALSVFVEKQRRTAAVINENLDSTGLQDRAEVLCMDVGRALEIFSADKREFDIIFMDPPYHKGLVASTLHKLVYHNLTAPGGLVIAECAKTDLLPEEIGIFKLFRQEKYGDTVLAFYSGGQAV